jgi:hypothetical protein
MIQRAFVGPQQVHRETTIDGTQVVNNAIVVKLRAAIAAGEPL